MMGESLKIKKNPKIVALPSRTCYDLFLAFSLSDSIDSVYAPLLNNPWVKVFDKDWKKRKALDYNESYESYLSRETQLVFAPEKYITDNLKEHNIPALTISLYGNPSYENYIYFIPNLIKELYDSKEVTEKVDSWSLNLQSTIEQIQKTLEKEKIEKRTVYYVRGDKNKGIGYTDNKGSFSETAYRILGCIPLQDQFVNAKPSVEEILKTNPDIIVVGGIFQKELIGLLYKEPFKNLTAVKNNKIYNIS